MRLSPFLQKMKEKQNITNQPDTSFQLEEVRNAMDYFSFCMNSNMNIKYKLKATAYFWSNFEL